MTALVNVDAECVLLSLLMQDNRAIDAVADTVLAEDFADPDLGAVFSAIVREASANKPANPVTLRGYFEDGLKAHGGPKFLMELCAQSWPVEPRDAAAQIVELSRRRSMQAGLQTAAEACGDLSATIPEIVEHADAALNVTGRDTIHQPTGGECFDELLRSFSEKGGGVRCGVIPDLDDLLGPMKPKQLIIGAGRPGMGKTAMALSYALGAARAGHGVLFVSLEMSSTELAARMAADLCFDGERGVPFNAIRDGDLVQSQVQTVARAAQYMHGLPFNVIDAGSLTIGRLNMLVRRHARRMAARGHRLELVVVDYLQLVSPDGKGKSNYEAVSEVSRGLKALAKDHDLAVFALAQLSRSVEQRPDKRPQLSDLRDSGQIEQDADAVLFLLRQEYYLRQCEPERMAANRKEWEQALEECRGQIEFILAKRRNGTVGQAMGSFHGGYQAVRGAAQ